ncbi:MAG: Fur family transcriptional regulator [Candidatus Omnitrophota bacterium]|nr:Fur family transcriptional regulator [Candidatus Omnitrophota bacterium]
MNKQAMDISEVFRTKCRKANLKITPQRTIIFESLIGDKGHPSADLVFQKVRKKIPNISFDTVNRTLLSFVDMGFLKVVEGYGRPKRFDPDMENHHHFQCLKCNAIIDFSDRSFDALEVPAAIKNKFTVTGKKVVLEGLCGTCRR